MQANGAIPMSRAAILTCLALAALCSPAPAQIGGLDELLAQTAKWQYETSRQPKLAVSQIVAKAQSSPAETRAFEQ
jgi:hypothetical protein